jgi:ubiquinone/menaquinone biosynthesis C-methylase UbiE
MVFWDLLTRATVRLFGVGQAGRFFQRIAYSKAKDFGISALNWGYAPLSDDVAGSPRIGEPYQMELYRQGVQALGECRLAGGKFLEISCGLGGGLRYVSDAFDVAFAVGLDYQIVPACLAHKEFGLAVVQGDANALQFPGGAFDAVLSIEAWHLYFGDAFLAEARRVLRPGGRLVIADFLYAPLDQTRATLDAAFARNRLSLVLFRDITENVAAACLADSPRREALVRRLPAALRPFVAQVAAVAKSRQFTAFRERRDTYYLATVEKQGK